MTTTQSRFRARVPLIAALAALALCLCAPQALARYVYTGNYEDDTLSVIDTATNQVVGSPIPTGSGPDSIAITPDGKTLYVTSGAGDITVVNTQTNQIITTITGLPGLETIAISPDGKTAYVSVPGEDEVIVIDLQTNQVTGAPIPVGGGPLGLVFSPDGKAAYVANYEDDNVSVIDTATRQVVGSPIPVGDEPSTVVVSPDGKTLYVNNEEDGTVSAIDTATNQVVGSPIPVGEDPWGLALSPDGARLYVANTNDDTVSVIDTATRQVVGGPISVDDEPYELAVTPDGKSVYVANYGAVDGVTVISTQTNQVSTTVPVPGGPWQVAIVPDQSPVASFATGTTKKDPLNLFFSGLGSTDPDGSVARYDWSFGDGVTAANGGPAPTHKYAKAGIYSVGLTVTDNEGCSVNMVFTGRTAHCSGNSGAAQTQAITVKAPNNFKFGKLKRNVRKGTAKLTVRVPAAGKLIVSGKKVRKAQRSAKKAGKVVLNIRPKPKAKKQLAKKGSAKVRIKVKFRPTGGTPRTKGKTLKLIQR
jgi:YVTN family beta-propeller protein